jgi:hypothetical protein
MPDEKELKAIATRLEILKKDIQRLDEASKARRLHGRWDVRFDDASKTDWGGHYFTDLSKAQASLNLISDVADQPDQYGQTVLYEAPMSRDLFLREREREGYRRCVRQLKAIKTMLEIQPKDSQEHAEELKVIETFLGITPLREAVSYCNTELVQKSIELKADLNQVDYKGQTALHDAASLDDLETVKQLIEAGADPNKINREGATPLLLTDSKDVKKLLIEKMNPETINQDGYYYVGQTALHEAASLDDIETVKQLLNAGADPNKINGNGDTPLHIALRDGNEGVVKRLLQDPSLDTSPNGAWWNIVRWSLPPKIAELVKARVVLDKAIKGLDRTIKTNGNNKESAQEIKELLTESIKNPDDKEMKASLTELVGEKLEIAKENQNKVKALLRTSNFIPTMKELQSQLMNEQARELGESMKGHLVDDSKGDKGPMQNPKKTLGKASKTM